MWPAQTSLYLAPTTEVARRSARNTEMIMSTVTIWARLGGLEPRTSDVSECRHSSCGSGLMAVTWAYAYSALPAVPYSYSVAVGVLGPL